MFKQRIQMSIKLPLINLCSLDQVKVKQQVTGKIQAQHLRQHLYQEAKIIINVTKYVLDNSNVKSFLRKTYFNDYKIYLS